MKTKSTLLSIVFLFVLATTGLAQPNWTVNPYDYQHNGSITGEMTINGVTTDSPDDILGVFVNGECRGFTQPIYVESVNKYLVFIDFYSNENSGETLEFRFYNADIDFLHVVNNQMEFTADMSIGTIPSPYTFYVEPANNSTTLTITPGHENIIKAIFGTKVVAFPGSNTAELDAAITGPKDASGTVVGTYLIQNADGSAATISAGTAVADDMQVESLAEDGTSVMYDIALGNNNADLSGISLSFGNLSPAFDADTRYYDCKLPFGTQTIPQVSGNLSDSNATLVLTQASEIPGVATLTVTAEDEVTIKTYQVSFSLLPNTDAGLKNLIVAGYNLIPGFQSSNLNYTVQLPHGTSSLPDITIEKNDVDAAHVVNEPASLPGEWSVILTAADGITTSTYTINLIWLPNEDATLASLTLEGVELNPAFSPGENHYTVSLPSGTTTPPTVQATASDANASVEIVYPDQLPGTYQVIVTAADGTSKSSYWIEVLWVGNTDASISEIRINDLIMPDFDNTQSFYNYALPEGDPRIPVIQVTPSDPKATVEIVQVSSVPGQARITVYAENTSIFKTFWISFELNKQDATLQTIRIAGVLIVDFSPFKTDYSIELPAGTLVAPEITAECTHQGAGVAITQAASPSGIANILVFSADGSQSKVYYIHFSVSLGIHDDHATRIEWNFYPNPAGNEIQLELINPTGQLLKCSIRNSLGQEVHNIEGIPPGSHQHTIDTRSLSSGSYWIILQGEQVSLSKVLIISDSGKF